LSDYRSNFKTQSATKIAAPMTTVTKTAKTEGAGLATLFVLQMILKTSRIQNNNLNR
jgi:hypothetical protein